MIDKDLGSCLERIGNLLKTLQEPHRQDHIQPTKLVHARRDGHTLYLHYDNGRIEKHVPEGERISEVIVYDPTLYPRFHGR
jgi:hypothetical protein